MTKACSIMSSPAQTNLRAQQWVVFVDLVCLLDRGGLRMKVASHDGPSFVQCRCGWYMGHSHLSRKPFQSCVVIEVENGSCCSTCLYFVVPCSSGGCGAFPF